MLLFILAVLVICLAACGQRMSESSETAQVEQSGQTNHQTEQTSLTGQGQENDHSESDSTEPTIIFNSWDEVPDSFFFNWLTVGRPYVADVWDYDVYSEIGNYSKPVLLMHGDRDGIVPISYAERAAEVYPDVEYHVISGGGHGFYGAALDDAFLYILQYLQRISII